MNINAMKKLINRETSEIGRLVGLSIEDDRYEAAIIIDGEDRYRKFYYPTMERFMAKWEDYEEPKKHHYYIEPRGQVIELSFGYDIDELKEELGEIGNYFATREEAEKAVEKLKAWKRLKDKGFKITDWNCPCRELEFAVDEEKFFKASGETSEETREDLDLLFGGEE